jgi:hypothetical protein
MNLKIKSKNNSFQSHSISVFSAFSLKALKINYKTEHFWENWNYSKFQLKEAQKIIEFFSFNFILSEKIDDKNLECI